MRKALRSVRWGQWLGVVWEGVINILMVLSRTWG
jgi:hypothetical protein